MSIEDNIEKDLKEAMTQRKEMEVLVLRMVKSAIHNQVIASKKPELSEQEVTKILSSQRKKHQDAIEAFDKGNRDDLVQKEKEELEIINRYLPKQVDSEEVKKVVQDIISSAGDGDKQFGAVMKQAMAKLQGQADGKLVSQIVKDSLSI